MRSEHSKGRGGTLLSSRRGTRTGREERREISRRREGTVPAPGPSGSPPPPLPTAEKRQLPPGREAMPSGARAPSGVQGAAPPSPILRDGPPEPPPLPPGAQTPAPRRRPAAAARPRPLSPRRCHQTPARSPRPGPGRTSPPGPSSHLSSRCRAESSPVPASAPLLRRRHSSSRRRRHRVLHPRRSHMEQPSQPWRSREPGSAAPRGGRRASRPPPPGRSRPASVPHPTKPCRSRRSAPSTPSPAFPRRRHHHYLPRRTSHTNPPHSGSTAVRSATIGQPRAGPAPLGGEPLSGGASSLADPGAHHRGSTPKLWRCFPPAGTPHTNLPFLFKKKKNWNLLRTIPPIPPIGLEREATGRRSKECLWRTGTWLLKVNACQPRAEPGAGGVPG